ncbi:EmrB/QacA subfamily drug resistance transporter [Tenggerimyces flavus]|nr:EmrB/QacA subfamily drug resistance transporter [Tenggerimyces flavus]
MTSNPTGIDTPRRDVGGAFAALLTAVLAFSLMQTLVVPALPDLQRQLDASTTVVPWVLSAFLLTASVATGLLGRLGDMFGKRRMLLVALLVFGIGTLIAAMASSIGVLIAARAIQGLGAATMPLAIGIVRDVFPRDRVPIAIGWISATFGVGFGVGLVVSGLIVASLGWQWIFWLGLVVIVASIAMVAAFVPESSVRSPGRVDVVGAILLSAGLTLLLLAISQSRVWNAVAITALLVAAAGLLVAFVLAERRIRQPLVDVRLLSRRPILTTNVATLIIGFGMFGTFTLIPLYVGSAFGASVVEAGLFLLPMAAGMLAAGPIAGRLGAKAGFKTPLVLATTIGVLGFALFAFAHDLAWTIYAGSAVLGIATGFAFAAVANLIVTAVDPRQTGEATGINTIMRTIGGSLGTQSAAAVVAAMPGENGYTAAFAMSAVAMVVATIAALAYPRLLVDVADHEEHRAENRDQVGDDAAGDELGQHGDVVERGRT